RCWEQPHDGTWIIGIRSGFTINERYIVTNPADALFELPFPKEHERTTHPSGGRRIEHRVDELDCYFRISTILKSRRPNGAVGSRSHEIEPFSSAIGT